MDISIVELEIIVCKYLYYISVKSYDIGVIKIIFSLMILCPSNRRFDKFYFNNIITTSKSLICQERFFWLIEL